MTQPPPAPPDTATPTETSRPERWTASWWRGRVRPPVVRWAGRVALATVGALLGILLFAHVDAPIGPFDATVSLSPGGGGALVDIPPLGALAVDAYDGPLELQVQLRRVDELRAQALASDPKLLNGVVDQVAIDLRSAVVELAWTTAVAALGGAAVLSLLALRRWRESVIAVGLSTAMLLGTAGLGAATWRPEALSQPTYTGLLVNATSLIGSAQDIVARYDAYRASLEDLVTNVSTLYSAVSTLPAPGGDAGTVALLHVADLHLSPTGFDLMAGVVNQFGVDGVLDTGDITDWGTDVENRLTTSVADLGVPYVFIRGNHDSAVTAAALGSLPNVTVLDDSAVEVAGITVAGTPDPRFTPDKDATGDTESLEATGEDLARFVATLPDTPSIALVHDPKQAPPLDGVVPLVLAGHTHEREVSLRDGGTRLMVEGSTGGAGLRGLQGEDPTPLSCTVLYLDAVTGELTAYDEITLGGLGQSEVTIERTVVDPDAAGDSPAGAPPTPDPLPVPASPTD